MSSFESRLSEAEARLNPHPRVVTVVYRPEPVAEGEDTPDDLTAEEIALRDRLLAEALEAEPHANGYSLFLDPDDPRWVAW